MSATILVVEDNAITRKMLRVALEAAGYRVLEASDGATALELAGTSSPDLVLLDIVLPDLLGADVATRLRRSEGWANRPIIALSGISPRLDTPSMMSDAFTEFLVKPIDPSMLLEHVAAWLPRGGGAGRTGLGRRILVLDDDPVQRKLQRIRLEELGFAVVDAKDGADALDKARVAVPDVVLVDLLMPGMSGIDFCLAFRKMPAFAQVPIVLTSSTYSDIEEEDRRMAGRAGANAFVVRTPGLDEIVEALFRVLEQGQSSTPINAEEELRSAFTDRLVRQLEVQAARQASLARQATIAAAQRSILAGVSDVLASRIDLHAALQEVLWRALDAGDVSVGAVFLAEPGRLRPDCWQGFTDEGIRGLDGFYGHQELLAHAVEHRTPVILSLQDADDVSRALLRSAGVSTMVLMPLLASGEPHGVLVMASRDDRPSSDLLWSSRILGAQIGQAIALARSLTELAESEQHFRELAGAVREVFYIAGADLRSIIYLSPAFEDIWGRSCASMYQSPQSWQETIYPDDLPGVVERIQGIPDGSDVEYRIVRPDQSVRWIRSRSYPVLDAAGRLQRILGTAEDITERRQLEQQLQVAQKMEAVGRLAAGLAHDFNNLLTVISGHNELLESVVEATDQRESLNEIAQAVRQASDLTRQLLAFSRQQVLRPRVLDLNGVVTDMLRMLSRIIGEDIEITSKLAADLGAVRVDSGQIEQVLMNLVVNARDAMPNGGRLMFESANVDVDGAVAQFHLGLAPGPYVSLTVSDTGSGMSPEVQARVFEPFYTTKEQGKGTGLGLSTVYGIIKQSGGYVSLYSELGRGTSFKIYLPRVAEAAEQVAETTPREPRGGAETILLVEDNDSVRRLSAHILHQHGYAVIAAANGEEALELSERYEQPIHLICTDMVMPGLNGLQVVERVRRRRPGIGVLLTSGYSSAMVGDYESLKTDAVFLQKPYTIMELIERIDEALNRRPDAH